MTRARRVPLALGVFWVGLALAQSACAPVSERKSDLSGSTKADRWQDDADFDADNLVSDAAFTDVDAVSAPQIADFLVSHGSVLAGQVVEDASFAEVLVEVARNHRLSPLVLLATLQKEHGLVTARAANAFTLEVAFGCGCHDGENCERAPRGLEAQLGCAAGALRSHFDAGEREGGAPGGFQVGVAVERPFLRGNGTRVVTPANRATVALYAYTPWVESNYLFFDVFTRFADKLGYSIPSDADPREPYDGYNDGFVGDDCEADADCRFAPDAVCLRVDGMTALAGRCTIPCTRNAGCPPAPRPDGMKQIRYSDTTCVELDGSGYCMPQCDHEALPETDNGCPPAFECRNVFPLESTRVVDDRPRSRSFACMPEGDPLFDI